MSDRRTYVLESEWTYDHTNHEYATFCFEETDLGFEVLTNPKSSRTDIQYILSRLHGIFEAQCPGHGNRRLLRLYRLMGTGVTSARNEGNGTATLHMELQLIGNFDASGNLIPLANL